jgi:hypothetical protein
MADNIAELSLTKQAQLLSNTAADGTGTQKLVIVDSSGHLLTAPAQPTTLVQFKTTVGTSVVQLATNTVTDSVTFVALAGNNNTIYLGGANNVASSTGFPLAADASVTLKISNTNLIYAIGGASGQVLHVIGG